ncbi:MAG: DUF2341 domain-containing protein, partial [Candidatus Methanomethylicia archaeon]
METKTEETSPIKSIIECSKARIDFNANKDFKYRIPIIINNTLNSNNLEDYQVLVTINTKKLIEGEGIYELPIYISSVGTELTDYQIKINITDTSILRKISDDGRDIRFFNRSTDNPYSDTNGLLPYWIEEIIPNQRLVVWVKVPNIPASGGTTIYMYYGNYSASSMSNGDNTFIFFDDFSTDPNTNGKWRIYRYAGVATDEFYWDSANNRVYLTKAVNWRGVMAFFNKQFSPYNTTIEFDYLAGGGSGADGFSFYFDKNITPYITYGRCIAGGSLASMAYDGSNTHLSEGYGVGFDNNRNSGEVSGNHIEITYTNSTYPSVDQPGAHLATYSTTITEDNTWHSVKIVIGSNFVQVWVDGNNLLSYTGLTPLGYNWQGFGAGTGALNNNHIIKKILVRKYTSQEPTINIGSERAIAKISLGGKMRSDCGDIRFTDSDEITLLNYWIEPNTCNTENTRIWVKVPNIPANSNKIIYLYYGNPSANSLSDTKNVFIREIDGLVLHLTFDEGEGTVAYDYSGNNNHGSLVDISCIYRKSTYLDKFYEYISYGCDSIGNVPTWKFVKSFCEQRGGYLVVINSSEENNFVKSLGGDRRWIGLFQDPDDLSDNDGWPEGCPENEPTGCWQWLSNEPSTYSNWYSGEPDTSHYHCAYTDSNGYHYDASCYWPLHFVCEYTFDPESFDVKDELPQWISGVFGEALSFNGIDDYVTIGNRDILKMTSSFTLCSWLNIPLDNLGSQVRLMGQGDGGWPDNYRLELDGGGVPKIYIWKLEQFDPYVLSSGIDIRGRGWTFVCAGYDKDSGNLFIQVDDTLKTSYIGDVTPLDTSANVFWIMAPWVRAKGSVDEVRVFNRSLTQEEISDLYSNYGYSTPNYPGKTLVRKYTS